MFEYSRILSVYSHNNVNFPLIDTTPDVDGILVAAGKNRQPSGIVRHAFWQHARERKRTGGT